VKKLIAGFVLIVSALGILAFTQQAKADCVNLYIDYGPLNNGAVVEQCVPVTGDVMALDLLSSVNLSTEGTLKYGSAVLCRLGGFPDASVESCTDMPPAESYWAVLVKENEIIPWPFDLQGEWGWAQTGIDQVHLHPGESLGLVFADNGEVPFP
jgi:hypothetical protein